MTMSQVIRRSKRGGRAANRFAFTMLEIMTSVTLALMLMYAVARIFSHVGGAMNETTGIMETTNALRSARHQLTTDLENLSVEPAPPRNSRRGEGFLCYVEGMGGPWNRVFTANNGYPFSTDDVALDSERCEDGYALEDYVDNTVGDTDDILSFTAKAPAGQTFRGRYVEPIYNDAGVIVDGKSGVFEAQYAEIIWFVRGTTLYRRILPIVSKDFLEKSFEALRMAIATGSISGVTYSDVVSGFGFYRFYDVSVHLETRRQKNPDGTDVVVDGNFIYSNSVLVANTLGDLTNRANRYFYWNSCGKHKDVQNRDRYPLNLCGAYGLGADDYLYLGSAHGKCESWYWLRAATLQECASKNFRAGAPFGQHSLADDYFVADPGVWNAGAYSVDFSALAAKWPGYRQLLTISGDYAATTPLDADEFPGCNLPARRSDGTSRPFIDFWNRPYPWNEVNFETGDLSVVADDDHTFNQDVVLTNVLSFNVKVWDPKHNAYVDLGSNVNNSSTSSVLDDPDDLQSYGYYGRYLYDNNGAFSKYPGGSLAVPPAMPALPCVYDTWTEQYQRDYSADYPDEAEGVTADIPADGAVSASQLKDYPPPYNTPLKAMQVELRVYEPRSKTIRNTTFTVDFSHAGE